MGSMPDTKCTLKEPYPTSQPWNPPVTILPAGGLFLRGIIPVDHLHTPAAAAVVPGDLGRAQGTGVPAEQPGTAGVLPGLPHLHRALPHAHLRRHEGRLVAVPGAPCDILSVANKDKTRR